MSELDTQGRDSRSAFVYYAVMLVALAAAAGLVWQPWNDNAAPPLDFSVCASLGLVLGAAWTHRMHRADIEASGSVPWESALLAVVATATVAALGTFVLYGVYAVGALAVHAVG